MLNNDDKMVETVEINVEHTGKLRSCGSSSTLIISVPKGIREVFGLETGQMVTILFKTAYKGKEIVKKLLEKPVREIEEEICQEEEQRENIKHHEEVMKDIVKKPFVKFDKRA